MGGEKEREKENALALCWRLKCFSLALGLSLWKQEVGQQAKEVMLLSVLNCSDGCVLVPGPLLRLLAVSSWLTAQQCPVHC